MRHKQDRVKDLAALPQTLSEQSAATVRTALASTDPATSLQALSWTHAGATELMSLPAHEWATGLASVYKRWREWGMAVCAPS